MQLLGNSISLLRVYLAWMILVAVLFLIIVLGIYVYAIDVLSRERELVSTLLPELDTAYQLSAATSDVQSQSLLLRSAPDPEELNSLRESLLLQIESAQQAIDRLTVANIQDKAGVAASMSEVTSLATKLADVRHRQFIGQQYLSVEKERLLLMLSELEASVQSQVVSHTEVLLESTDALAAFSASGFGDADDRAVEDEVAEFERLSLAIQDLLLLVNDIASLMALVERVPLLVDVPSVAVASQSRDLLLHALVNRSVYINFDNSSDSLLKPLRVLRTRLTRVDNLFELREKYLEQDNTLSSLADNLGIQTTAVLQQTQRLRSDTRTIVNSLAQQTVQDLQQYRIFLVLVSTLVLLALALLSYWLVYRKTVLPLIGITRQLDDVGKVDFPQTAERYFLAELSSLSAAVQDLDVAQKQMQAQDMLMKAVNQDLRKANEELEQFAHIASHDLQEPLRKLQQFSVLLEEDYQDKLDEDGKFFLDTIRNSADRMSVLIRETLAYSRAGSSNQTLEVVDLSKLTLQLRDEMDVAMREAQADIHIHSLPVVMANSLGMAQLFRNLMINALKYRKPDVPAEVIIGTQLDVTRSEAPKNTVSITVQDNGIGIDEKYLDRIFAPFERLHSSKIQGTGLGLAICRKVCDSHGWRLNVRSTLGQGTTFEILLPNAHLVTDSKAKADNNQSA